MQYAYPRSIPGNLTSANLFNNLNTVKTRLVCRSTRKMADIRRLLFTFIYFIMAALTVHGYESV